MFDSTFGAILGAIFGTRYGVVLGAIFGAIVGALLGSMFESLFGEASEISRKVLRAEKLRKLARYDDAITILKGVRQDHKSSYDKDIYTRRHIEEQIAGISANKAEKLSDEGKDREACSLLVDTLESSVVHLREDSQHKYKNLAALYLLESGDYARSYAISMEVASRQAELLSPTDRAALLTQSCLARALNGLEKCDESLALYRDILQKMKTELGNDDWLTITTQLNMAEVLLKIGAAESALKQFEDVFERRKRILGAIDLDTLTAQNSFAEGLIVLDRLEEAFDMSTQAFNGRKEKLGSRHPVTLKSQVVIGLVLIKQAKYPEALKLLNQVLAKQKLILGDTHPDTQALLSLIGDLKTRLGHKKFADSRSACEKFDNSINLIDLINLYDVSGVKVELDSGIDITQIRAKNGDTPLHIAVNKNCINIIESLLAHASLKLTPSDLQKFINAGTKSAVGDTAMHIAASKGSLRALKVLLKHGAIYNIKNKEGETPREVANDPITKSFLESIEETFDVARFEGVTFSHRLERGVDMGEVFAISSAKDDQGKALNKSAMDCYMARYTEIL